MPEPLHLAHLRASDRWIAWVRLGGVAFALLEVFVFTNRFPPGYERAAAIATGVFGAGAVTLFLLSRSDRWPVARSFVALGFDLLVVATYATIFSYEWGSQTRWAMIFVVAEGALRYGLRGGAGVAVLLVPFFVFVELWRAHHFGPPGFLADRVSFPVGVHLLTGLIVGWLVTRLHGEATRAQARAAEAEGLRDELGRRADRLEAVNRCARALGSSLDLTEAFGAFIRELSGVLPFDRTAIALIDGEVTETLAVAGLGASEVGRVGTRRPIAGSLAPGVLQGLTTERADLTAAGNPNERALYDLGLRSRVAAPLLVGARPIGILSVLRRERDAFTADEVELVTLLGRLAGTAVHNIRAYEAERRTAEELRRLSALRADFVSLVSHELRSPMAAVIGSARTLQGRWRQLSPEQRDSFLALIADETDRLTRLIGDVLDTSRIEAGTFSYVFADVDVDELVGDAVTAAGVGQDEVPVRAYVAAQLPRIRGDRERLRQVLTNLIDNAVKYSPAGSPVEVAAAAENGGVRIDIRDDGPGIPPEQQGIIFEKFGRAQVTGTTAKPGSGLGLFIARSIAEAHGGSLVVRSTAGEGAVFTLTLPAETSRFPPG